jgi:hypothetical protein
MMGIPLEFVLNFCCFTISKAAFLEVEKLIEIFIYGWQFITFRGIKAFINWN